jgi:hypothetical protein
MRDHACSVVVRRSPRPSGPEIRGRASFDRVRTSTPPPSTKMGRLKSTDSMRESVIVVVPQTTSTLPLVTASRRVEASTGIQSILSSASPSAFCTAVATRTHSSTLYPRTRPSRSW